MKAHEINELKNYVSKKDIATMLSVYSDQDISKKNNYIYNIMRTLYIINIKDIPKSFFKYYKVKRGDTWNLIAYTLFGSVELYWLILKLNEVKDPTFEPQVGTFVRYISKENINQILDSLIEF